MTATPPRSIKTQPAKKWLSFAALLINGHNQYHNSEEAKLRATWHCICAVEGLFDICKNDEIGAFKE